MQDLTSLSSKLNEKSENINSLISSMNEKLSKMNIGIETWIQSNPLIGYLSLEGEWQLAVRVGNRVQPLIKASRDTRIDAMQRIPTLLEAIRQNLLKRISSIEAAEKAAEKL